MLVEDREILKDEFHKQTGQMLQEGIISHSMSSWNSSILMVPKKVNASGKQKWRMVVKYRNLKQVTICDNLSLPLIANIVDSLGSVKFFLAWVACIPLTSSRIVNYVLSNTPQRHQSLPLTIEGRTSLEASPTCL
jgi:hypothetical protein